MIIFSKLYSTKEDKQSGKGKVIKLGANGAIIGGLYSGGKAYEKAGDKILQATRDNYARFNKTNENIIKAAAKGRIKYREELEGCQAAAKKIFDRDQAVVGKAAKRMQKVVLKKAAKGAIIGGGIASAVGLGLSHAEKKHDEEKAERKRKSAEESENNN